MVIRRFIMSQIVLMTIAASFQGALAHVPIQPIALSNEPAPAVSDGSQFVSGAATAFGLPLINNNGDVAFWGQTNLDDVFGTTKYGIWVGQPDSLSLLARTGDAAPGLPVGTGYMRPWVNDGLTIRLNEIGEVAFSARITGSPDGASVLGYAIWAGTPGQLELIVRNGDAATAVGADYQFSLNSQTDTQFPFFKFNDEGMIASTFFVNDSNGVQPSLISIWTGDGSGLTLLGKITDDAPGTPENVVFDALGGYGLSVNLNGRVAFQGGIAGPGINCCNGTDEGIWITDTANDLQLVVRGNQDAIGMPAGTAHNSFPPYYPIGISETGKVAFTSRTLTAPATYSRGLWVGSPNDLQLVANSGMPTPGLPGGSYADFGPPAIIDDELLCFTSLIRTGVPSGYANATYIGTRDDLDLIIYGGMQVPNMAPGVVFQTYISSNNFNRHGQFAFIAWLEGPGITGANSKSLWIADRLGHYTLIMQTGVPVEIAPGDFRTYQEVELFNSNGGEDGRSRCFNDSGELVFRAKTGTVGDTALLLARVPISGDCNLDGEIDLDDVALFVDRLLTDAISGCPANLADLNADGSADGLDVHILSDLILR